VIFRRHKTIPYPFPERKKDDSGVANKDTEKDADKDKNKEKDKENPTVSAACV
jgi:hypothetical protein